MLWRSKSEGKLAMDLDKICQVPTLMSARRAAKAARDDTVPCQIEEGLFLGSLGAANNKKVLKSLNISHILTVASMISPAHPDDFKYKIINVLDKADTHLAEYFDECFDFIDEAKMTGGAVLVHCFMGISRSTTVVVAYLMKKHGMTLSEALEHVTSRRPQASPNLGFMLQLRDYEKSLESARKVSGAREETSHCEGTQNASKDIRVESFNK